MHIQNFPSDGATLLVGEAASLSATGTTFIAANSEILAFPLPKPSIMAKFNYQFCKTMGNSLSNLISTLWSTLLNTAILSQSIKLLFANAKRKTSWTDILSSVSLGNNLDFLTLADMGQWQWLKKCQNDNLFNHPYLRKEWNNQVAIIWSIMSSFSM